jgi:hypothetical protein
MRMVKSAKSVAFSLRHCRNPASICQFQAGGNDQADENQGISTT